MRTAIVVSILAAVLGLGVAAYAAPPIEGTYKTSNGDFDEGTATHRWQRSYLDVTDLNTMYGRSTSGGVFTNDWTLGCSDVVQMTLLVPKVGPNGQEIWKIDYRPGAYFNLGGPGNPWNGGDATYVAITDYQTEIRTVQYANDLVVGAVSDHSLAAHFQNYHETCVAWAIGNGTLRGGTVLPGPDGVNFDHSVLQSVKPAGYPDFPIGQGNCTLLPDQFGHWEDVRDLTLSITGCTVKTQQSSWGAVKAMYRK
jgi:hypothetical protein